jgi:hypothetical protein
MVPPAHWWQAQRCIVSGKLYIRDRLLTCHRHVRYELLKDVQQDALSSSLQDAGIVINCEVIGMYGTARSSPAGKMCIVFSKSASAGIFRSSPHILPQLATFIAAAHPCMVIAAAGLSQSVMVSTAHTTHFHYSANVATRVHDFVLNCRHTAHHLLTFGSMEGLHRPRMHTRYRVLHFRFHTGPLYLSPSRITGCSRSAQSAWCTRSCPVGTMRRPDPPVHPVAAQNAGPGPGSHAMFAGPAAAAATCAFSLCAAQHCCIRLCGFFLFFYLLLPPHCRGATL